MEVQQLGMKETTSIQLVGGVEMWNGLVSPPHVVDENSGGISWEQGVPAPHQTPQPRVPVQEDKSP